MKKLSVFLLIVVIVGYAAFKGGAWYQTRQALIDTRERLDEMGVLRWSGIGSGLSGQVSVSGLQWSPFALSSPITADRVVFRPGGVAGLWPILSEGRLPDEWSFSATGVQLMLKDELLQDWIAPDHRQALVQWLQIPCGGRVLGVSDLRQLGIGQLNGDLTLRSSADRPGIALEVNAGALGSIDLYAPQARPSTLSELRSAETLWTGPVQVTLRDGGLMRKLSAWCAEQGKQSKSAWTASVLKALEKPLAAMRLAPSEQLASLYRTFLRDGGALSTTLQVNQPFWGVPVRAPDQSGEGASLNARYNGNGVPGLYLSRTEPDAPTVVTPVEPEPESPAAGTASDGPAYRAVGPEAYGDQLGRDVRIELDTGRVVEGRLSGVSEHVLEVTRMMDGGEVAYPLDREAIVRFAVWRAVPTDSADTEKGQ
ncbi:hypothetical protein CF392_09760 [Tamilnaduibacter salinus]|uniref:Acetylornithine deacetylase n=1 Tax=Tamilnaduibacter salinus TaxID=1484056 RepID=A0A2A2I2W8_9GAMM|nr:hypothetical protein [Tamilnaduibacter salinus]PAV25644.1 hypothetical protein CF392_09760 [Tamilnaduibacter salinus]